NGFLVDIQPRDVSIHDVHGHLLTAKPAARGHRAWQQSAPRAPRRSGATIQGADRCPGQTFSRAQGTIVPRPATRQQAPNNTYTRAGPVFIIQGAASAMCDFLKMTVSGENRVDSPWSSVCVVRQAKPGRSRKLKGACHVNCPFDM